MKHQRGVALVLVLAVTGIVGLLILQIGLTARQQVTQAQRLVDRAEATMRLHSRESAVLYSLLTRERNWDRRADLQTLVGDNPYAAVWNFRGEPFEIDGASIRLQDMGGLFSMPTPDSSPREFATLLVALGIEQTRAEQVSRALQQSLQVPPKFPLQSVKELGAIGGLAPEEIERLEQVATVYPVAAVNPGTAPLPVLAVKYTGGVLEGLVAVRREGLLDESRLASLIGENIDETTTNFVKGPGFRLDITIEFRGVRLRRESVWTIRPADPSNPLQLWSYRGLDSSSAVNSGERQ